MQKINLNTLTRQQKMSLYASLINLINSQDIAGLQVKPTQAQINKAKRLLKTLDKHLDAIDAQKQAI
jgi:hypothetical protein